MVFKSIFWRIIVVAMLVVAPAHSQTRAQKSVITQLLWQTLLQCYKIPEEFVSGEDRIVLRAELNTNGDIANLPDILSPNDLSKGERALLRQATTALIMCTPFISESGDRAIYGSFDIVADQSGLSVSNVEANVGTPDVVPNLDTLELAASEPVVNVVPNVNASEPAVTPRPQFGAANKPDEDALGLSRTDRRELQRRLSLLGYDTRGVDGVFGPGSRRAVTQWQVDNAIPPTGYFNQMQVDYLRQSSAVKYEIWDAQPKRYTDRNGCLREANGKIVEGRTFACDLASASQSLGLSR